MLHYFFKCHTLSGEEECACTTEEADICCWLAPWGTASVKQSKFKLVFLLFVCTLGRWRKNKAWKKKKLDEKSSNRKKTVKHHFRIVFCLFFLFFYIFILFPTSLYLPGTSTLSTYHCPAPKSAHCAWPCCHGYSRRCSYARGGTDSHILLPSWSTLCRWHRCFSLSCIHLYLQGAQQSHKWVLHFLFFPVWLQIHEIKISVAVIKYKDTPLHKHYWNDKVARKPTFGQIIIL